MAYSLEYFHVKVLAAIEAWPADLLADYARLVELLMEYGSGLGLPHSRALVWRAFRVATQGTIGDW